jgi:hypothetical protein
MAGATTTTTTTTTERFYTMEYFDTMIFRGLEYSLPADIIHSIQDLQKKLGVAAASAANTPNNGSNTSSSSHVRRSTNGGGGGGGSWIRPPAPVFKSTVVVQERNSLEKDIADIRVSLNKISDKNFEKIRDGILASMAPYFSKAAITTTTEMEQEGEEGGGGGEAKKLVETIIEISSSYSFLSKINARLYKEIAHIHPTLFSDVLSKLYSDFISSYECAETLENQSPKVIDRRRATTQFLMCLFMENVLPRDDLFGIMRTWLERAEAWSSEGGKTVAVEEITEALFLLVVETHTVFSSDEKWDAFYEGLAAMSEKKAKDFPSLSNRAIFKFRDLMDLL